MQWLNVSYSVWFNRRHNRAGHLFQGRFKSLVIEDDAGWQEVARYLHLNPVRLAGLGLNKHQQAASRRTGNCRTQRSLVGDRLRWLRDSAGVPIVATPVTTKGCELALASAPGPDLRRSQSEAAHRASAVHRATWFDKECWSGRGTAWWLAWSWERSFARQRRS